VIGRPRRGRRVRRRVSPRFADAQALREYKEQHPEDASLASATWESLKEFTRNG